MAELEENIIHERSRTASLTARLAKEAERRQATQDDLDIIKQTLAETKRDLSRQVERLQEALDSANEVSYLVQALIHQHEHTPYIRDHDAFVASNNDKTVETTRVLHPVCAWYVTISSSVLLILSPVQ